MLLLIVLAVVLALAALAVLVFVAVVLAIHSEPNNQMTTGARSPLAAMVRRLLGVYAGKPTKTDANDNREECLTGSSTDWWNKGGSGR